MYIHEQGDKLPYIPLNQFCRIRRYSFHGVQVERLLLGNIPRSGMHIYIHILSRPALVIITLMQLLDVIICIYYSLSQSVPWCYSPAD